MCLPPLPFSSLAGGARVLARCGRPANRTAHQSAHTPYSDACSYQATTAACSSRCGSPQWWSGRGVVRRGSGLGSGPTLVLEAPPTACSTLVRVPQDSGVGALSTRSHDRSRKPGPASAVRVRGEAGATRPGSCGACRGAGSPASRSRRHWRSGGPAVPSPALPPLRQACA